MLSSTTIFKRYKKPVSVTDSANGILNTNEIIDFYNSFLADSLTPEAVSEALPNYTQLISNIGEISGSILPIVRSNFEARTKGNDDDVVVVFINNNINYSNTIMLYMLEVAKFYSSRAPKLQFYSINMSLNELPEYGVEENSYLPAIKLFSRRNNKTKPYDFHDDVSNFVESVSNIKIFIEKYMFNTLSSS